MSDLKFYANRHRSKSNTFEDNAGAILGFGFVLLIVALAWAFPDKDQECINAGQCKLIFTEPDDGDRWYQRPDGTQFEQDAD